MGEYNIWLMCYKMYKKTLFIFASLFILSSCFGGWADDNTTEVTGLDTFSNTKFVMWVPASWDTITQFDDILPTPYTGEIELVSIAPESKKWVKNNLLVLSETLDVFMTSSDLITSSQVRSKNDFYSYTQNQVKNISFSDGTSSILYVFEAQYNKDTPAYTFVQTARVCNANKGFIMTITLPKNTRETQIYEQLLQTFSCISQDTGEI